jgi:hypothetical protein
MKQDTGKNPHIDLPLFAASTPECLIVGIGAGLALGIDEGDWICREGGFGIYAGGFSGYGL